MKRVFICMLCAALCTGLFVGCSSAEAPVAEGANLAAEPALHVVTTIFPQYDIVRSLGGSTVEVTMLLKPGTETHSYDPSPQDIITIQNCDIFIYVGGESDDWADRILASMDTSAMEVIALMELVEVVEEEYVEGMEHSHSHEEEEEHHEEEREEPEYDEHVWTSPKNAVLLVEAIAATMAARDTQNADSYLANAAAYTAELEELDTALREVVDGAVRNTILVGDRFPFRYMVEEYGLAYYAAFSGCASDTDASASTIAFLIDKTRELALPVVFYIELSSERIADTICEETDADKLLLHSGHNLSKEDFDNGVTYLEVMWQNVETLRAALW